MGAALNRNVDPDQDMSTCIWLMNIQLTTACPPQLLKTHQKVADLGFFGLANPARKKTRRYRQLCLPHVH